MIKFSLFKNSFSKEVAATLTLDDFIERVKTGAWEKIVERVRETRGTKQYKMVKKNLPAVAMSGEFSARSQLKKHSGIICVDVDKKDNPRLRTDHLVDKDALAQFVSCGGEGIKIVYYCKAVKDVVQHRRIFDAVVERLKKKGITLTVDPVVKSVASFQYVSFDPQVYYKPKTKLVIAPLPPIKNKAKAASQDPSKDITLLEEYIDLLNGRDITEEYENWLNVMFGLSYSLGEAGRPLMHKLCCNYPDYDADECDDKYDACLERDNRHVDNPVTIASVFQLIHEVVPKAKVKHLAKKHNAKHAIGESKETPALPIADLAGRVQYGLFLFKKVVDKETHEVVELQIDRINLNTFEDKLRSLGFFRFESRFVRVVENIVESMDVGDIFRVLTDDIKAQGDYRFTYGRTEFSFSWEEIIHKWREARGNGHIVNQLQSALLHWEPNLLKDTQECSFIPYLNGVVRVDKKGFKLLPYSEVKQQIWKERILPRNFTYVAKTGMFEEFFVNVMGRGDKAKDKSIEFKRSMWYYGYMLHTAKRQSTARAWILYDMKSGNNGRTGKSIMGTALSKIRNVAMIDGKRANLNDKFALQTVQPWTNILFIDDPKKETSITSFFNMITGSVTAEKKGLDAFQLDDLKLMFATNWVLESEGRSESGRQFVSQVQDFYSKYADKNKHNATPIVAYHGKEFFTDWNEKDWAAFDSFAVRALQWHLREPVPQDIITGNSQYMRFIQQHGEETFIDLRTAMLDNWFIVKKDGRLVVPVNVLAAILQEQSTKRTVNECFKVAREWLHCIGFKDMKLTTTVLGAKVIKIYVTMVSFNELYLGEGFNLPKKPVVRT